QGLTYFLGVGVTGAYVRQVVGPGQILEVVETGTVGVFGRVGDHQGGGTAPCAQFFQGRNTQSDTGHVAVPSLHRPPSTVTSTVRTVIFMGRDEHAGRPCDHRRGARRGERGVISPRRLLPLLRRLLRQGPLRPRGRPLPHLPHPPRAEVGRRRHQGGRPRRPRGRGADPYRCPR